ncbi:MAG: TonB-dependent receptor [Acidobacteria bacterium]|nr:TonB-dependent receptor [Acidobacteriota bacterium]
MRFTRLGVLALSACLVASSSWAQSAASSTIHGTVKDTTGGALPGVTVTLASRALQVGQTVAVTDAEGNYRFSELPAGTYRLTFELSGFQKFVREEMRITVGFVARVDATMGVGTLEESITVSGQSPVVDLTSTSTASTFTKEALDTLPRGRDLWAVIDMAPGVTQSGAPDVGGSRLASRRAMSTYGMESQPKLVVEGINVSTGGDANSAVYLNYFAFEEIQFKTSGADAEVGVPGINMVAVLRSGGNEFHGQYGASYQGPKLQSSNLSETLRGQGLRETEPLKYHYDVAGDLGGRIMRDKLWFYGGFSRQQRLSSLLGFVSGPGPDGRYLTGDEPLADYDNSLTEFNLKLSYQLSRNNRLIGVYQKGLKLQPQNGAGRFRPLEATRDYRDPTWVKKLEWQSTIKNRTLINVVGGYGGYFADYSAMRNRAYAIAGNPSRLDRETGVRTGPYEASDQRPRDNWQADGSISFFPERFFGGRHELKTGSTMYRYLHATGNLNHPHGNYYLIFDRVGGVPNQPVEIEFRNYPLAPRNRVNMFAWYLKDTWRVNDRVTANLGVRWERQEAFVPAQSIGASPQFPQLFAAGSFPKLQVVTWNRALPRAGLSWDLGGKTVVKTSFGLYNYLFNDADAGLYNKNALVTARFRWRDRDSNGDYTPGEVNLDLNGPDFINITGARNNILNPDLKQPKTTEATAFIEHELAPNLGVRAGYVFRRLQDYYGSPGPNVLRPREAYNISITRRDPGPDGILDTPDDGGRVTFFDYDPTYRGAAFVGNQLVNSPNDDRFHSIEASLTKRMSNRWMASASFFAVKNHLWITRTFDSANDDFFPLDETWGWAGNFSGSYQLPWNIQLAGFLVTKAGVRGQRTYVFRRVDPGGGPPINQLSTVTLRLEPYGTRKGAAINVVNLRASKDFSLGAGRQVGLDVDLFNLFNSSAPTSVTWASGPTFGYATEVLNARVMRIGARFSF